MTTPITKCFGDGTKDCDCEGCYNRRLLEKDKPKTYFVVLMRETDGDPEILRADGDFVRRIAADFGQEEIAILEGNLIKNFDTKMDLSKL